MASPRNKRIKKKIYKLQEILTFFFSSFCKKAHTLFKIIHRSWDVTIIYDCSRIEGSHWTRNVEEKLIREVKERGHSEGYIKD